TKKPVAPGSRACVDGRKAPIGLLGEALMPTYFARLPLTQPFGFSKVAVPAMTLLAKSRVNDAGIGSLFGTRKSMIRSPVWGPGDIVKPNVVELPSGVFVPLSEQVPFPVPLHWPCIASPQAAPAKASPSTPKIGISTLRMMVPCSPGGAVH